MAALLQLPLLPPPLVFPMDLTAYGIRREDGNVVIANKAELKKARIDHIVDPPHTLIEAMDQFGTYTIQLGSTFKLNNLLHTVGIKIGNPGRYGIGYLVDRINDDATVTQLFLKAFINHIYNPILYESRQNKYEGIMQAIIHKTTEKPPAVHEDCVYTPNCKLFTANVPLVNAAGEDRGNAVRFYILQENYVSAGGLTLHNFLSDPRYTVNRIRSILVKLARKLFVLQRLYLFNHGDLHADNVFVVPNLDDGSWSPRLIDYGFSLMRLNPVDPETEFGANNFIINRLNAASNLTHLVSYLRIVGVRAITDVELFIVPVDAFNALRNFDYETRTKHIANPYKRTPYAHRAIIPFFDTPGNQHKINSARPISVLNNAMFNVLNVPECILPAPAPVPVPVPAPAPVPAPVPAHAPAPVPAHAPMPVPVPAHAPMPVPDPAHAPMPVPALGVADPLYFESHRSFGTRRKNKCNSSNHDKRVE
jgi:hypothetical protein